MIVGNTRVSIEKEFASAAEAVAWLQRVEGLSAPAFVVPEPIPMKAPLDLEPYASGAASTEPTPPAPVQGKRPRKPRNDAGKPRGPYKTNGGPGSGPAGSEVPAETSAVAPVSPTNAAPQPQEGVSGEQPPASPASVAGAAAAPLTEADARAALKRINETPGLGMEAVMAHLRDFGTNRASLLKPEQYADFIKQADEKIAAVKAAAGRDAKVAK